MLNYTIKFKLPQSYVDDKKSLDSNQLLAQCKAHYNSERWLRYRPLRTDVLQVITKYQLSNVQIIWLDNITFAINLQSSQELDTNDYLNVIACMITNIGPDDSVMNQIINETTDTWVKTFDYLGTTVDNHQPDGVVVFDQCDFEQQHNQNAREQLFERIQAQNA